MSRYCRVLAGQIIEEFFDAIEEAFGARAVFLTRWAAKAFLQLFQQLFLLVVQPDRCFYNYAAQQVTLRTTANGFNAFPAHADQFAGLGFRPCSFSILSAGIFL